MEHVNLSWSHIAILMWILAAICILLTIGRYIIRYKIRKRFYWDDCAHLIAVVTMIAVTSLVQKSFAPASLVVKGNGPPPADAVLAFRKIQVPLNILFLISLYAVKFSFMFFYQLLFWVYDGFRKAWWGVAAFCILGFWAGVAGQLTRCGPTKYEYNVQKCAQQEKLQKRIYIYLCAVNVATDLAVMILPLSMLGRVRIRTSQKVGLAVIFSIALVTVALDILRTIRSLPGGTFSDNSMFGILEMDFTVMISCVPTYRALLGIERRVKGEGYAHWDFTGKAASANAVDASPLTKSGGSKTSVHRDTPTDADLEGGDHAADAYELQSLPAVRNVRNVPSVPRHPARVKTRGDEVNQ